MSAATANIPMIEAGVSYSHVIGLWTQDGNNPRVAFPLAGYDGRLDVKRAATDAAALVSFYTGHTSMVFSGNEVTLFLPTSATEGKVFEDAVFDLVLWPTGDKEHAFRVLKGSLSSDDVVTTFLP